MAISTRFLLLLSFLCGLSQTGCAVTETTVRIMDPCESDSMYQNGNHSVVYATVEKGGALCCSLWLAFPEDAGRYPVVQFQHGFLLRNTDYKGLLTQVASWGFIVVAPQMYATDDIFADATTEINNARSILYWMKAELNASLPDAHQPDFDKGVALAGHSRGGKVAFDVAKFQAKDDSNSSERFSAIVGLDPVDAMWPSLTFLKHKENSIDVGVPSLIVGAALGSQWNIVWKRVFAVSVPVPVSPCAPKRQGHVHFYRDLTPPSFHFVATDNGHMDFTDDCSKRRGELSALRCWGVCKAGPSRQCMRQFSAGILVAFLQNSSAFSAALTLGAEAPVPLDLPQCKLEGNISCPHEAQQYADM